MVFIPRWEKYKDKKPSGLVEVNYANELAQSLDIYNPLDGSNQVYGKSWAGDSYLASSGNDTTYLEYVDTGLKNTAYDGDYNDGMGLVTPMQSKISGTGFCIGFCITKYPGSGEFTGIHFGVGDILSDDASAYSAYNALYVYEADIVARISNASVTFTNACIQDSLPHTYVIRYSSSSGTNYCSLYIDGVFVEEQSFSIALVYQRSELLNISTLNTHHNRGLNGIVHNVFLYNTEVDSGAAQSISENPYQILKPRQSFFVIGAAAGTQTLNPSLFTNSNSFPSATVSAGTVNLAPSLVTNTNSFYSATLTTSNTLTASVVTNTQTFHDVTLTTSNSIVVDLYANDSSFYSATVIPSNNLQASLVTNTQTFYSPVVSLESAQVVAPNLFTNSSSFYNATVQPGAVTLSPSLVTNNQTFYTANVSQGAVVLQPDVLVNNSAFYNATVSPGTVALQPSLTTNSNSFYTAVVSLEGSKTLAPSVVTNSSTFHSAAVTTGSVTITADHWSNTSSFYAATVISVNTLQPALVTNAPSFYTHVVTAGAPTLQPSLLTNSSVFYTANVTLGAGTQTLQPPLVVNNNVFYNGQVVFDQTLTAELFVSQPAFYSHVVTGDAQFKPGGVHLLKASSRVFTLKAIERSNFKAY